MAGFAHILAGFSLGFRHRHVLTLILEATSSDASILSLDPYKLQDTGISLLALDFDGVLAPHGFEEPLPEADRWLKKCVAVFGEEAIFILSNKPTESRKAWFTKNYPSIRFISGVRKKPYPDGLHKIREHSNVPLSSILMVDDRLLTACLAAVNAGAVPCYVRRPYISLRCRPFTELFFMLLRAGERTFVKSVTLL